MRSLYYRREGKTIEVHGRSGGSQALSRLTPTNNGPLAFSPGSDQSSAVVSAPALLGDKGANILPSGLWTLPTGHPGPVVVAGGDGGPARASERLGMESHWIYASGRR